MAPNTEDFRRALTELLKSAEQPGVVGVNVRAGNLHKRVGGYPQTNNRMAICCGVMREFMLPGDEIVQEPPSRDGASVTIRYRLPRRRGR